MTSISENCSQNYRLMVFVAIEAILIISLLSLFSINVSGGLSVNGNATVLTTLGVANVAPEILNMSINQGSQIVLNVNSTKVVTCEALIRDFDNDTYFDSATGVFFNTSYTDPEDNNAHYTNNSCSINRSFVSWKGISDTIYTALVNCTFRVAYYAAPGNWNCTIFVNNTIPLNITGTKNISIAELLGLELPNSINYGLVNSTSVSQEETVNISNAGNIKVNLSLSGYAKSVGDGNAMNCSGGPVENISIMYEKFNLTASNDVNDLPGLEAGNYTNLTASVAVKQFDLGPKQSDITNDAVNSTYWRIYVPVGIAGTCNGNVVFGATKAAGS